MTHIVHLRCCAGPCGTAEYYIWWLIGHAQVSWCTFGACSTFLYGAETNAEA